jgi:glycine/D-amino acid oxidase-like deaminating enzyme
MSIQSVAVVGAGVVGLVSALEMARAGFQVIVLSAEYSAYWDASLWDEEIILGSNLVSDVAAASFIPHSKDSPRAREWISTSSRFYADICNYHPEAGVVLRKGKEYVSPAHSHTQPWYSDYVFNMRFSAGVPSDPHALSSTASWHFETFLIEPRFFIPWLRLQLEALGVTFQKQFVESFSELSSYDVVVNCTGLGARKLAKDESMEEVAGQVLLLKQPCPSSNEWIRDTSQDGSIAYVYPQRNTVVVGGTKARELSKDAGKLESNLRANCARFGLTELANAPSIGLNGGHRPGRREARVEIDSACLDESPGEHKPSKRPIVIHNYGHSGEGYCLAPGCAVYVVSLLNSIAGRTRDEIEPKPLARLQSQETSLCKL